MIRSLCSRALITAFGSLMIFAWPAVTQGQGRQADYERARSLRERTKDKVFRDRVDPHWFAGNNAFWYRNSLRDDTSEFIVVDAEHGTRQSAFDHQRLAESLAKTSGQEVQAGHLPFTRIQLSDDRSSLHFQAFGKDWKCSLQDYGVEESPFPSPSKGDDAPPSRRGPRHRDGNSHREYDSPNGGWIAWIKDHNVHLRAKDTDTAFALTTNGNEADAYRGRIYWSPDSKKLVALRTKRGGDRKVYLIESSPKDQLQPKLDSYDYLKPGDPIPQTQPHLFDAASREEIPVSNDLFPNPWSIDQLHWQPDSGRFTFVYNQRGHQLLRVVAVDAGTGEAGALIDESSKTFVDYAFKQYIHYADATDEIIWMSERDGWNHLYLIDARTGHVKNRITRGPWVVRGVDRVDETARQIWFRAGGIYPEQDPYYIHHCRVAFDGSDLVILTAGNGTHKIDRSPDGRFILDTYSRVDMPPISELRDSVDGRLICELERADMADLLETGWQVPERFAAKGRDGKTDIYGVIWRPTTFDSRDAEATRDNRYPVIEQIYAGPHGSFVPKQFSSYYNAQSLAELGFIVVQIDGMGTSNRSKAFHDVCWKNLGDSGFPDRIAWIRAAAVKYPYMDTNRIGIYGGSAGGQSSTRALLAHGDFYKVAVSDCGCHDNRMDKIWWNELWMGWPVGPHYAEQSNVTQAHQLQGKLLLIVGELDRNVDPASTMQVVDALIKADKDFEMLVVPGGGHGIAESSYGKRRRRDFFVRHLLGVEPRLEASAGE